jgi:hypothetical protein
MTIIIAAAFLGLSVATLFLVKGRSGDSAQLRISRPPIPTMGVQIVCGNCSGDNLLAQRTYLDYYGNCEQCGGQSYILAAALAAHALHHRNLRVMENAAGGGARVLPFDAAVRAARSEKVAS